jgi:hypothetical protein
VSADPAELTPDAALVLGIASTAMPFARTPGAEAERWLRVLRLHGEVGIALQALGVSEAPLGASSIDKSEPGPGGDRDRERTGLLGGDDRDAVAQVTEHAVQIASRRSAAGVATTDLLMAVMHVYGADFDRVLRAHGTDCDEVLERLGARAPG